jgi:peptide chain release factor subunit 3
VCVFLLLFYQVGYTIKTDVKFIPISALSGDNILQEVDSSKCKWWKESYSANTHNTSTPTLISTLDSLRIDGRKADGALRIPCLDRYFERGTMVLGKVESGTLRVGEDIIIMPTRKKAKVEEVMIGDAKVRSAKPGENVIIKLNVNVEDIQKGFVLCYAPSLCPAVREIKVQLMLVDMLEHRPVFTSGYEAVMHVHTVEIEITCVKLISVTDKGKEMARQYARNGQICTAKLSMPLTTCMDSFERMASLGRVTLRDEGRTIAIGKILELYRDKTAAAVTAK